MDQLTGILKGDRKSFQEVYLNYHGKLLQYIFQKTGSTYYANEVAQITFIKLWERKERLRLDIPLEAQIFQIAKTTLIDVLRKMERERVKVAQIDNNLAESMETGYGWGEKRDAAFVLQRAMGQMPPMRKKVFSMRIEGELSYLEIANTLSISVKTVSKHLELAMQQIRPILKTFLTLAIIYLVRY